MGRKRRAGLEPTAERLEGRAVLSYLVVPYRGRVVPVYVSDSRTHEPLHSNGLAVKKAPRFYNLYTGPRRPELNGVQATGYVSGKDLVLTGTVAAPINTKPKSPAEEGSYTFGIDRGGASERGPFPGREHVRFDTVVVAIFRQKGLTAYVQLNNPTTNQPGTTPKTLPASSVTVDGSTLTVRVPLSQLPSTGHAMNQWNVNFFTRNPAQKPDYRSVASLTPEFTNFQVHVKPQDVL